jgi:putative transposase
LRRIVGYAMSRRIDVRLTLAALDAALGLRRPIAGCVHHTDCGSQYTVTKYSEWLHEAGLVGSMSRRGNPFGNAQMESMIDEGFSVGRWLG